MSEETLQQIAHGIGFIKGELKGLHDKIDQRFDRDDDRFAGIVKDVDALKKKMWFGSGFAAAVGALFGIFIKGHQ